MGGSLSAAWESTQVQTLGGLRGLFRSGTYEEHATNHEACLVSVRTLFFFGSQLVRTDCSPWIHPGDVRKFALSLSRVATVGLETPREFGRLFKQPQLALAWTVARNSLVSVAGSIG